MIELPEEPTQEMIDAAIWALDRHKIKSKDDLQGKKFTPQEKHRIRYKAMIEAFKNPGVPWYKRNVK